MASPTSRRRWTIAGVFLGVGLVSWLGAMGTSRVAGAYLSLPDDASLAALDAGELPEREPGADDPSPPLAKGLRPRTSKSTYVDPIVRRNIFDSSAVGAVAEAGPAEGDRKSDLKVVLLATMVVEPEEFSSALIAEEKGSGGVGYGVGDDLLGEGKIVRIEQKRVHVRRNDGSVEYIAMEEGQTFTKEDAGRTKRVGPAGDDEGGVTKEGDNKFVVDQDVVDKILENPEQLYSQVRAVPHKGSGGEIDGYRLSGIRRKSFFHQLGIKNGDIVHTVNGKPLTSMSAAMDAYNSLQNDKNFSFDITRRNQRQTFEYEIR